MVDAKMLNKITSAPGFIAALDQSGGSTPGALRLYGINESDYSGDDEMYRLIHAMRVRIMKAPAFSVTRSSERSSSNARWTAMWMVNRCGLPMGETRRRSFLKIDKGLLGEENGVQMMKPMPDLDALLIRGPREGHLRHQDALGHRPCGTRPASPP